MRTFFKLYYDNIARDYICFPGGFLKLSTVVNENESYAWNSSHEDTQICMFTEWCMVSDSESLNEKMVTLLESMFYFYIHFWSFGKVREILNRENCHIIISWGRKSVMFPTFSNFKKIWNVLNFFYVEPKMLFKLSKDFQVVVKKEERKMCEKNLGSKTCFRLSRSL